MPKMGYDMETGLIVRWLRAVGDQISRGDAIAEIETDKVTVEMEAVASGFLVEITAGAGEVVAVGAPIGYIEDGE